MSELHVRRSIPALLSALVLGAGSAGNTKK